MEASFRVVYGRFYDLHGPRLEWCYDAAHTHSRATIIQFRLVPDEYLRAGEPIVVVVGDIWQFIARDRNTRRSWPLSVYIEFPQIRVTPWCKSTLKIVDDVQISWHLRSSCDLSFLAHNGIPSDLPIGASGTLATPSLHVIAMRMDWAATSCRSLRSPSVIVPPILHRMPETSVPCVGTCRVVLPR